MAGIKITLVDDVAGFLRGVGKAEDALSDVAGSLDDVAREAQRAGNRAGDNLGDGVRTGARDAGDATERLERSFRDLADTAKRETRQAGDAVGDNVKAGTSKAGEGLDEMNKEAAGTATEVAASFDGSADSIAGGFQELAANAFAGFGPAGQVAGLAAAAGIGLAWQAWQGEREAAAARITELADTMIAANSRVVEQDFINSQLTAIYTGSEDAVISIKNLGKAAEDTGVKESELARAFSGDQDARVRALAIVQSKYEAASRDAVSLDNEVAASGVTRMAELGRWRGDLERLGTEYDSAAGRAVRMGEAVAGAHTTSDRSVGNTRAEYERLRTEMDRLPATKTVTGRLDTAQLERDLERWRPPPVTIRGNIGMRAV